MSTKQLFIPKKLKIGFKDRQDTYTGKLAFLIYYDQKGKLRKEKSWQSWRSAKIDHLVAEMDLMTLEFVEQYADANQELPTATPKLHATEAAGDVDEETDDQVAASASA